MLDLYLEASYGQTKEAEAKERQVDLLKQLPDEVLMKIASGEEKLAWGGGIAKEGFYHHGRGEQWLDRFKGTPLFEQALQIEQEDLQSEMAQKARRQEQSEGYREEDAQRDDLSIKRKMLDLDLAKHQEGGGGEEEEGGEAEAFAGEETPEEEIAEHAQMQAKGEVPAPTPEQPAPVADEKTAALNQLSDRMAKHAEANGMMEKGARGMATVAKSLYKAVKGGASGKGAFSTAFAPGKSGLGGGFAAGKGYMKALAKKDPSAALKLTAAGVAVPVAGASYAAGGQ